MDEPFTLVERTAGRHPGSGGGHHFFEDVVHYNSAKTADHDLPYTVALRKAFPELIVTTCPEYNAPLRSFAAAGFSECEVDKDSDSYASWRGYYPPSRRLDKGLTGEEVSFAKYHYKWQGEDFILFIVGRVQYILKEPQHGEHKLGPSAVTDKMIRTIGDFFYNLEDIVWVYDSYWRQDSELFKEIQKASWDKVILDEDMKDDLTHVAHKFFDSESVYRDLGVPWKRGLLFHGPPGNGKTISIKALMNSLWKRKKSIPSLYVRSAPYTYNIESVFSHARAQAPCMLILEDIETIVTSETRSYFFNEMDGLANNDGLFIVASTNFLDRLDPGLTKRPSRFDRKYLFPIPNEHERTLYCEFWRQKLKPNKAIIFPKKLCQPMAAITPEFSFAYMQECFTATLLIIANRRADRVPGRFDVAAPYDADNDNDLEDYELWRVFKEQAQQLRRQIGNGEDEPEQDPETASFAHRTIHARSAPQQCACGRADRRNVRALAPRDRMRRMLHSSGDILPDLLDGKDEVFTASAFETI